MTADVFTVHPDMPLQDAAREMTKRRIRHLPVVQGRQLLGVISMRNVTGVFAALSLAKVNVEHEFDHLVRERRLARSSTATWTSPGSSTATSISPWIEHGDLG